MASTILFPVERCGGPELADPYLLCGTCIYRTREEERGKSRVQTLANYPPPDNINIE
jgi:hypothetical protein